MDRRRLAAALIGSAALLSVGRIADADGWLWVALAASAFLIAYARQRVRGLLVLGCVLAGVAAGLLLGGLGVPGAFWVSLGVGVMAIDRIEPEPDKRTLRIGAGLGAFGLLWGVVAAGWLYDGRFALLLLVLGGLLLLEGRRESGRRAPDGHEIDPRDPRAHARRSRSPRLRPIRDALRRRPTRVERG